MKNYGLIGFPLSHSFSEKFFTEKFENEGVAGCKYSLFPIESANKLPDLLAQNPSLCGLNVTIPHKVSIMPYLNEIDVAAQEIGAVNCIKIENRNGKSFVKGFNTDAIGFEKSIAPFLNATHKKALVFGDGGAAQAVKYVLKKLSIEFQMVTRKGDGLKYEDVDKELLAANTVLINTTPLGMYPNFESAPAIPYQYITNRHLAYDLVYNPEETTFLRMSKEKGATIKNGMEMLVLQAEASWLIWN